MLDLLKRPEGKTLEFTRDLSSPDGVLRGLVAFANTSGGAVLIGVEDRTRHVRGLRTPHLQLAKPNACMYTGSRRTYSPTRCNGGFARANGMVASAA